MSMEQLKVVILFMCIAVTCSLTVSYCLLQDAKEINERVTKLESYHEHYETKTGNQETVD